MKNMTQSELEKTISIYLDTIHATESIWNAVVALCKLAETRKVANRGIVPGNEEKVTNYTHIKYRFADRYRTGERKRDEFMLQVHKSYFTIHFSDLSDIELINIANRLREGFLAGLISEDGNKTDQFHWKVKIRDDWVAANDTVLLTKFVD